MLFLDLRNLSDSGRVRIGRTETGLKSKIRLENTSAKSEPDEKQLSFPASAQRDIIPRWVDLCGMHPEHKVKSQIKMVCSVN